MVYAVIVTLSFFYYQIIIISN